jgi:hypothetical protein
MFSRSTAHDAPAGAGPVSRDELDALRRELAAFKRVAAIGFMAAEEAGRFVGHGGLGSAHQRMEKIAAVASELFRLDAAEVQELRGFLRLLEAARDGERRREFKESEALARPRCADDYMPGGRLAPRV